MSEYHYKEHTITLIPSMEGLMWACQYVIMQSGKKKLDGFPDGNTYDSRERTASAALSRAKALIDDVSLTKDPWVADIECTIVLDTRGTEARPAASMRIIFKRQVAFGTSLEHVLSIVPL
jgi:hypothetical protein